MLPLQGPCAPSTGKKPLWVAQDPPLWAALWSPPLPPRYDNTGLCRVLRVQKHTRGDRTLAPGSSIC